MIVDGVVRVDASGVGEPPSITALTDQLDAALEQTLEVQLTWLKREDVLVGEPERSPDEVLRDRIDAISQSWADANGLVVQQSIVVDGQAVVEVTGPEQPDASDLVASIDELLGTTGDVRVLFTQRLDITTTATTTTTTQP